MPCDDGIVFDLSSLSGEQIRAADDYAGVRVRLAGHLAGTGTVPGPHIRCFVSNLRSDKAQGY